MIRILSSQIKQYKKPSVLAMLFTGGEVLMEVLIPFVTAALIDDGIEAGDLHQVFFYGFLMLVLALCSLICGILAGRQAAKASCGFACNLRDAMFEKIQTYSFTEIDKYSTAGLVTRMTTDVTNVQNAYQMIIRVALRAPLMLVCSMVMCFLISMRLSTIFLFAILFLGIVLLMIMGKTFPLFDEVFRKYDDLNASVQENVSAIRVVKAYVREAYENSRFKKAAEALCRKFIKAESILAFNNPLMMLTIYACILCISWFGAKAVVAGELSTGNLTSLFSYVMSVMMSLMMLSMIFVMISMSMAGAGRIVEVLTETPSVNEPQHPRMHIKDGSIVFDHVSFSYQKDSEQNTLSDIDCTIQSGETIGIIGPTGSGKTTLVNLICRLYDVRKGCIRIGNEDVRTYDTQTLRNSIAVVLQNNVLFSGTILDNLRWGNEDASLEECEAACRIACADEFIRRFPDRYDTWIEQGGTNVSGGQRQRLCIARALLKKPKILILDDSTSAVDTATDAEIRKGFAQKIPDVTKIIVSQRISGVQDADRILVLDNGRVSGFDTHEQLLKTNDLYRQIFEAQTGKDRDFDQMTGGDRA